MADLYPKRLCDLSWFMKRLDEYVARRANAEDGVKGRFWEGSGGALRQHAAGADERQRPLALAGLLQVSAARRRARWRRWPTWT